MKKVLRYIELLEQLSVLFSLIVMCKSIWAVDSLNLLHRVSGSLYFSDLYCIKCVYVESQSLYDFYDWLAEQYLQTWTGLGSSDQLSHGQFRTVSLVLNIIFFFMFYYYLLQPAGLKIIFILCNISYLQDYAFMWFSLGELCLWIG